jgi:DNA repair exonuclease SbcCD nuclease subunit
VFRGIVDRALRDTVDVVLIAGDLFDHNRVSDDTVAFVVTELARLSQPVVILPGNHDCLEDNGIYARHEFALPHVRLIRQLDGESITLPELDLVVWGRGMQTHEPAFQPLAHLPSRDASAWCIAMGHGFFFEERQQPDRSSPIFADEIRDSGWDYVALGHHHVQTDVSQGGVTAYYAGAPGSVLHVELSDEGVRVDSQPLT